MQKSMKRAFAGSLSGCSSSGLGRIRKMCIRYSLSISVIGALGILIGTIGDAPMIYAAPATTSREDLRAAITDLTDAVNRDVAQGVEVINAIQVAIAPPQSVTVGTVEGVKGATATIPIYLKSSTAPVSGLQFDIPNVVSLTVSSVAPGLALQAVGKSVSGNQNISAFRVLIVGFNQTVIPSGPIVILKVNIGSTVAPGKKPISLSGLVGTSPSGSGVTLTARSGSLTVR